MEAHARHKTLYQAQQAQQAHETWMQCLSILLHEPRRRCRSIARGNIRFTAALETRRGSQLSAQQIRQRRESIDWPTHNQYAHYCFHAQGSHIIAACHFGDYVHCLNLLAQAGSRDTRHFVVREKPPCPVSLTNMTTDHEQMGTSPPECLINCQVNVLMLRQALKYQRCTLTSFFDLPGSHGVVLPVRFLGQRAWFSAGVASLAISAAAPVIPALTYNHRGRDRIALGPLVEPCRRPGESFESTAIRITQQLVDWLSPWILRFPEQWRYLPGIAAYLQAPKNSVTKGVMT